jgi:hypothetical protein
MIGKGIGQRAALFAVVISVTIGLASPQPSSAVADETATPFCEGGVLHDYLTPLEHLPSLHAPSATGQIGFGPAGLRLVAFPSLVAAPTGYSNSFRGSPGYRLFFDRSTPVKPLNWFTTATLARVDQRGRAVDITYRKRRHLVALTPRHGGGVSFPAPPPAMYRLTVVFRTEDGEKLGEYGFYFRVVEPTQEAMLTLSAASYSPEQTVLGRIDNLGTELALYGDPYVIERLGGSTWTKTPESPSLPYDPLYPADPGLAGSHCSPFRIPPSMQPGRYRMSKDIYRLAPGHELTTLTAEFEITP